MIRKFLILILAIQTDLLMAIERMPEIYSAMLVGTDFSSLTKAQKSQFSQQINASYGPWSSPIACAAWKGNPNTCDWLIANGAKVDDNSDILRKALKSARLVNPRIIETLLLHNVPTDIEIEGKKPIAFIENEIKGWQKHEQRHGHSHDILARYTKTRDILKYHELKLRMTWIRGLVQMERTRSLQRMAADVSVITRAPSPSVQTPATLPTHAADCKCCCLQ